MVKEDDKMGFKSKLIFVLRIFASTVTISYIFKNISFLNLSNKKAEVNHTKKGQNFYECKFKERFVQKRSQKYLKSLNYRFKLVVMHEECLPEKAPGMLRLFCILGRFLLFL